MHIYNKYNIIDNNTCKKIFNYIWVAKATIKLIKKNKLI